MKGLRAFMVLVQRVRVNAVKLTRLSHKPTQVGFAIFDVSSDQRAELHTGRKREIPNVFIKIHGVMLVPKGPDKTAGGVTRGGVWKWEKFS